MASERFMVVAFFVLIVSGCGETERQCSGFEVVSSGGDTSFTVPELMAHATAMGMTQREAETLIYLEGITATANIQAGKTLCIDGKPGGR